MSAAAEPAGADRPGVPPAALLGAGLAVAAALMACYAPSLLFLGERWLSSPNNNYGFLVGPIALAILWQRRGEVAAAPARPSALGFVALAGVLLLRAWLFERNDKWLEAATLPAAAAALALAFGGWGPLRRALPAIAFLGFMLPLPQDVNQVLAGPLQRLAAIGSTILLQAMGLPVIRQGNVILVGAEPLEVATACNGLSMLLSFVTLIAATVLTAARDRPPWERAALMLSAVPIALVSNVLRIVGTAWAYHALGKETGEHLAHDAAGWLMMPIALGLTFLELRLLSWVVVAEDVDDHAPLFPPRDRDRGRDRAPAPAG